MRLGGGGYDPGMSEETDPIVVGWTTVSQSLEAEDLAERIVASGAAACVQVEGPTRSFYTWEGRVHREGEMRVWVKTTLSAEPRLREVLRREHPYEVPQWVAVRAEAVLPEYADWVRECTRSAPQG